MQGSYSLKKVEPDVQKQCCGQGLKLNIFILNLYFFFGHVGKRETANK